MPSKAWCPKYQRFCGRVWPTLSRDERAGYWVRFENTIHNGLRDITDVVNLLKVVPTRSNGCPDGECNGAVNYDEWYNERMKIEKRSQDDVRRTEEIP